MSGATGEAEQLIAKLTGDQLSASESDRLAQLLAADAVLRTAYQRQLATHALLQWRHGSVGGQDRDGVNPIAIAELLDEAEQATRRLAAQEAVEQAASEARVAEYRRKLQAFADEKANRRPEPIVIPYSVAYSGAAALVASLLWLAYALFPIVRAPFVASLAPPVPTTPETLEVATIDDSTDARLYLESGDATAEAAQPIGTAPGTRLSRGRYQLTRGVIGFQMGGGARGVLEAPATLVLESADRVRLLRGRLVGTVPPGATGFVVETATATIVDLGTEFGVAVTHGAAADVTVFDGEVEVVAGASTSQVRPQNARPRQRLKVNESVQVDSQGTFGAASTSANLYFRTVPTPQELRIKKAYERWLAYNQRLAADPDVLAHYTFNDQQPDDRMLLNRAGGGQTHHGEIQGAQWEEGRWPHKQALRFASSDPADVTHHHVKMNISGRFDSLTLAAWVNIDALLPGHNGLLMTEAWDQTGQVHWQILGDGRLHVGLAGEGGVGSQGLDAPTLVPNRPKWTHLAIVYRGQESQLSFFIDGMFAGQGKTQTPGGLRLGASRLGSWEPVGELAKQDSWRALHGRMDELLVVQRAFSPIEVRALYRAGRP